MDYKTTLNLPKTDFAMKADLVNREPERLARWEAIRLYDQIQAHRAEAEKFVLHDGPPFANGDVHVGTATNKILKDIIVKYKTLRGYSAPYVPGWDCHGLPIEFKVTQEMRQQGDTSSDPVTIRKACEEYARKYIDIQRAQFKRLGVLGDWEHPYLTLDQQAEAEELRLFADIVEKGFVYRGKKPVFWSIPCRTALAEAEVEYKDHLSPSIYVKLPVLGQPATHVLIWTTTPWTLPANLAVAYNSTFEYSQVRVGDEWFILYAGLVAQVAEKCGWSGHEVVRSLTGEELSQLQYQHPFCNRTGRLFTGDAFVESSTGTGFVHVAPGHGLEDYLLGCEQGLPIYSPVDDDGRFAYTNDLPVEQQMPAELIGQSILEKHGRSDANAAVLHELRTRNALVHQENYHHSYPHCWRSKTPIIFRAMDQWFIRVDHPVSLGVAASTDGEAPVAAARPQKTFRELALDVIDQDVKWVPDWGKHRMEGAVKSRPDWCISRQRTWGVPIPAFYDADGNPILDARIVRNAADLVEQHGSTVWFEKSAIDLWNRLKPRDWNGPEAVAKSHDTLDVWIDSGSTSRTVLMQRRELHHVVKDAPPAKAGGETGYWKFEVVGYPNTYLLVWTEDPDRLPEHPALVCHSAWPYNLVRAGDADYIVAVGSLSTVAARCEWGGYMILRSLYADHLTRTQCLHPVNGKKLNVLCHDAVLERSDNSGFALIEWQADMYLEGSDQHRGWFQSSLLLSLAGNAAPPYKTVLTHGFMVDAEREKISKSKPSQGGYEKPQTSDAYVKKWGVDILRLWVTSQDYRNDVMVSDDRFIKVAETYRLLRNTLRYQLSNLYDFDPAKDAVPADQLTELDQWILGEFAELEAHVIAAYDAYEFHLVYQKVSQFAAVQLSAVYHDIVKDRLYTDAANSPRRRSTQTALYRLVRGLCQMLAPILAFTADEAWECLPGVRAEESVHLSDWKATPFSVSAAQARTWKELFRLRGELGLPELEKARQAKVIGKALEAKLTLTGPGSALKVATENQDTLRELLNVSQLEFKPEGTDAPLGVTVAKADGAKCERCWHWETDVGSHAEHPTICGRCLEAITAFRS